VHRSVGCRGYVTPEPVTSIFWSKWYFFPIWTYDVRADRMGQNGLRIGTLLQFAICWDILLTISFVSARQWAAFLSHERMSRRSAGTSPSCTLLHCI
jgi:hypothetical protein